MGGGGSRDRVSVRPVGRCGLGVRYRQLIIRRRPKNSIDGPGGIRHCHMLNQTQQQKAVSEQRTASSLDLSEHEAGTAHPPAAGHMRTGGRIGSAPLALFVSRNVAMGCLMTPTIYLHCLTLCESLCLVPAQQAATEEEGYYLSWTGRGEEKASTVEHDSRAGSPLVGTPGRSTTQLLWEARCHFHSSRR